VKECARTTIRGNRVLGCFFAIYLSGSKGAVVEDNEVRGDQVDENRMANGISTCATACISCSHTAMATPTTSSTTTARGLR
jgi:parallel beta-helix repeat protein